MKRPHFVALVPVKPPARGKSRLHQLSAEDRARLAAGFALDTVAACLATPAVAGVLAVTDDAAFAAELAGAGCDVIPDGVADDLNEALRLAVLEATRRWPDRTPVAVCADLPALLPTDLEAALDAWSEGPPGPGFVSDTGGTGTTLYVAAGADFSSAFGGGSRAAHLAGGTSEIEGTLASLRRDVDDLADLQDAVRLGLGPHTRLVALDLGLLPTD